MRKVILAGNWKMHELIEDGIMLAKCVEKSVEDLPIDVIVFPPFTTIHPVYNALGPNSKVKVGAQNMYFEEKGAFTGEISPLMIKDAGAEYVILGHSERRNIFGETDELINKKVKSALSHNLKVILCVGEKLEERENGKTEEIIKNELSSDLDGIGKKELGNIIIAYEPIWAIGTGVSAKPEQAEEVHKFIRAFFDNEFGPGTGADMTVLYGGSVKPANIESLAKMPDIDGGLVGGASLKCTDFARIGKLLSKTKGL